MNNASNFKFSWRAVNALALWRPEILSACVVFFCAAATFQGLWQTNRMAAEKIAGLNNRLLFVKKNFPRQGDFTAPPGHRQEADAAQTIAGIRQTAQSEGLCVNRLSLKSEDVSKEKNLSVLPLEFSATAPQRAFLPFMTRLKNLDFLCRVVFLNARPDPSNDANLLLSLKLERLNLLSPISLETLKSSAVDFKVDAVLASGIATNERSIFKNILPPLRRADQRASPDPNALNIKDLNLAGIIDNGQLKAIIENKKEAKTYYLVKGDEISGLFIADILNQEVILERGQERYRLTL